MLTMTIPVAPELFKVFALWGSILALKLLSLVLLTARQRFSKKIFANPEDAASVRGAKVTFNDPDVERVRRAHLNDLENIPIWYLVTFLWLTTGPSVWLAKYLIKGFVLSRIVHTLVYAVAPKQPFRALAFFVGYSITIFQAVLTIMHYL